MKELLENLLHLNEDDLEDIFQPFSEEEFLGAHGYHKNAEGFYIDSKNNVLRSPRDLEFPILSARYSDTIWQTEKLIGVPNKAKATQKVVSALQKEGVDWIDFSRIGIIPKTRFSINVGLQSVGSYKDSYIIFETKVGVGQASAGYLTAFSPKAHIKEDVGATQTSSTRAYEWILKRLNKI